MIVSIDEKGRILIPKKIREKMGLKKGVKLRIESKDNYIILKKQEESIAEKYAGKFKPKKPLPENLDDLLNEVIQKWWEKNT